MEYSLLVGLLLSLEHSFGPVGPDAVTDFQEDCAGAAALSNAATVYGLRAQRRDESQLFLYCSFATLPRIFSNYKYSM